jgi:hypothetical protein
MDGGRELDVYIKCLCASLFLLINSFNQLSKTSEKFSKAFGFTLHHNLTPFVIPPFPEIPTDLPDTNLPPCHTSAQET